MPVEPLIHPGRPERRSSVKLGEADQKMNRCDFLKLGVGGILATALLLVAGCLGGGDDDDDDGGRRRRRRRR
jgi:hypothetical protein